MLSGCPRYFGSLLPSLSRANGFKRCFILIDLSFNNQHNPCHLDEGEIALETPQSESPIFVESLV